MDVSPWQHCNITRQFNSILFYTGQTYIWGRCGAGAAGAVGTVFRDTGLQTPHQGLKWGGMGRYGIPSSQSLSHGNTVYERRKERLGNVPFCI